jgi:hypothetical protein
MKTKEIIVLACLFTCVTTAQSQSETSKKSDVTGMDNPQKIEARYTRLDANGKPVDEQSAAHCVRDNETRLVWELKTDDDGVQDKDNTYRWGGVGAEQKGEIFFTDWSAFVTAVNNKKLCGFADWRVPTVDELKSLVIVDKKPAPAEPMINTDYFPLTLASPYWSTSAYANYPEHGQTVHFGNGTSYYYNGYRGNALPLRLVRGEETQ